MTKYLKLLVPAKDGEMQGTHTYCTTSPGMAHHCSNPLQSQEMNSTSCWMTKRFICQRNISLPTSGWFVLDILTMQAVNDRVLSSAVVLLRHMKAICVVPRPRVSSLSPYFWQWCRV